MSDTPSRRDFLATAARAAVAGTALPIWARHAAALGGPRLWPGAPGSPGTPSPYLAEPFPMDAVRVTHGPFRDAMEVNRAYLLRLDPDRLLHMFRVTAGLPSTAEPLGGWEAPDNELRGHFTGHYLSACALMAQSTGDDRLRTRGVTMVRALGQCQHALGSGYLSAFPETFFDRLRAGEPVWAPFYTLHKIMAGLLDTYTLSGDPLALEVVQGMARWTAGWVQPLGDEQMARILEREYGGMNEVLYNLSAVTNNPSYERLAHRFDHERIFAPLAMGRDELKGLHVNTTIPKIIGAARRYELTGEERYRNIAQYFWTEVTSRRAYCTGGTSNGESWNAAPGIISTELSAYTEECCPTYNMLKLTRKVFSWTADPRAADYYERALFNGILGTEHPADGEKLYYVPLASGYWKLFGTPGYSFWCCTGTGAESFSKFGDSIYFHDHDGIYVNLYIPSEVTWKEKGVRLTQDTHFPAANTTRFTVHAPRATRMALRLRIPYWIAGDGTVSLNGRRLDGFATPSSYFVLDRTWRDGDTVELALPMAVRTEPTPDDPSVQALMYGPLVLAGRLGTEGLTSANLRAGPTKPRTVPEYPHHSAIPAPALAANGAEPGKWIVLTDRNRLAFHTVGQEYDLELVPFSDIMDERYAVYWKVT